MNTNSSVQKLKLLINLPDLTKNDNLILLCKWTFYVTACKTEWQDMSKKLLPILTYFIWILSIYYTNWRLGTICLGYWQNISKDTT